MPPALLFHSLGVPHTLRSSFVNIGVPPSSRPLRLSIPSPYPERQGVFALQADATLIRDLRKVFILKLLQADVMGEPGGDRDQSHNPGAPSPDYARWHLPLLRGRPWEPGRSSRMKGSVCQHSGRGRIWGWSQKAFHLAWRGRQLQVPPASAAGSSPSCCQPEGSPRRPNSPELQLYWRNASMPRAVPRPFQPQEVPEQGNLCTPQEQDPKSHQKGHSMCPFLSPTKIHTTEPWPQ